ncbi:Tim44/TimA family putative adaptor protein [Xanthobacter autotrophicus]|uniref:Tim44/TimA family putative adaptor protein n=1 Tax=Xanthobacter TaxID=279 RepID=UPI0024ABED8E|nr:Tim44/TimA family putative adaptor protein [Xanthobacter autotrophicus]MDI4664066.1 Tim44/TimA family putative adaptor protein [Xanthobacter autotrophicus]
MLDIYTIIFLALAVFIFVRLRSVLGQRTGRERPPYDPYSRDTARPPQPATDKVVPLPERPVPGAPAPVDEAPPAYRWEGVAEEGTATAAALDEIARIEPDFDAKHFLTGARAAYEMIVTAFAAGDRRMLKDLLAKDVYDGFVAAIADRESRRETMESRFVAIEQAELQDVTVRARNAQLTVRFVSKLISVTRGPDGAVVDGSPDTVADVTDVWTFARDLGTRDPNWKLVATEAAQ